MKLAEILQNNLQPIADSYLHVASSEATYPFIVHANKGQPVRTKADKGKTERHKDVTATISVFSEDSDEAMNIADQVKTQLQNITATEIENISLIDEEPDYDPDFAHYTYTLQYSVTYNDS